MDTDVIIIGKGIAGLVLSMQLEQQGIAHVLLRRCDGAQGAFALAETLPPTALPLLDKLGLLSLFSDTALQKTYGYHSSWGSTKVADYNFYCYNLYKYGLKINKQAILSHLEQQQQKHIITTDGNFNLQPADNSIHVTAVRNGFTWCANSKLVVDATGRKRVVLRKLNVPSIDYDALIAFSCHVPRVKHPALVHDTYVESFKSGWGIVTGLNEKENVLTLFTSREVGLQLRLRNYEAWPGAINETTHLRHFLTGTAATKVKGQNANSSTAGSFTGERWLAVGDAAISFDPLSSHGITNALYTAFKAASAIGQYLKHNDSTSFAEYDNTLSAVFRQYLQTQKRLYANEHRWPQSHFWSNQDFFEKS